MKLLSPHFATTLNTQSIEDLYLEIKEDLLILDDSELPAQESIHQILNAGISGVSSISKKIGLLFSRILISLRNITEKVLLRHNSIITRWNNRIIKNLNYIDNNKFNQYVTRVVPYHILEKRIAVLLKLHYVIDNIESICEARVDPNSEDWRTQEIISMYTKLSEIGLDATRLNLLNKVSSSYDKVRLKATVENLGYTVSHLTEIIARIKPIVQYADFNSVKKISNRFVAYSDKLAKYEESLRFNEEDMSSSELEEKRHILKIKLARLWWVSHFIRATYVIADDIVIDVLKLCKIAEKCISKEDN